MNLFLNAQYYYEPNLKEIRAHENEVKMKREKSLQDGPPCPDWAKANVMALTAALSGDYHHIFDAHAIAVFRDSKWQVVGDGDFGAIVDDETQDCPVIYLRDWTTLCVGQNSKKQGDHRSSIEPSDWLEGYEQEWGDLLLEVANKYFVPETLMSEPDLPDETLNMFLTVNAVGNTLERENLISVLYRMEWESSVCWESGIDEGGFEISETIFSL